jgi:hypothetical protein
MISSCLKMRMSLGTLLGSSVKSGAQLPQSRRPMTSLLHSCFLWSCCPTFIFISSVPSSKSCLHWPWFYCRNYNFRFLQRPDRSQYMTEGSQGDRAGGDEGKCNKVFPGHCTKSMLSSDPLSVSVPCPTLLITLIIFYNYPATLSAWLLSVSPL